MKQEQIDRINALYRKSQAEGLTEAEKEEQAMLRKAYVADVKRNLVAQLNNIDMQNPDGTVTCILRRVWPVVLSVYSLLVRRPST